MKTAKATRERKTIWWTDSDGKRHKTYVWKVTKAKQVKLRTEMDH